MEKVPPPLGQLQLLNPEAEVEAKVAAMAEANQTRDGGDIISEEEASMRAEKLENGAGYSPHLARVATHQVDVRDITTEGARRAAQVKRDKKPPSKSTLSPMGKALADGAPQHVRDEVRRIRGY